MSWYTLAAKTPFIDTVQVSVAATDRLVLLVGQHRYEYSIDGRGYANEIGRWKRSPNKMEAGKRVSALMQSLEQYRVKPAEGQMPLFGE